MNIVCIVDDRFIQIKLEKTVAKNSENQSSGQSSV